MARSLRFAATRKSRNVSSDRSSTGNGGPLAYQVAEPVDIPNYWLLARTFTLIDTEMKTVGSQQWERAFTLFRLLI